MNIKNRLALITVALALALSGCAPSGGTTMPIGADPVGDAILTTAAAVAACFDWLGWFTR